jgi:ankyrin repeat protein
VRKYTKDVVLLYLLAERNLKNLIKASPSILSCLEIGNERYGPPIFASVVCKSVDTTQLFVKALRRHNSPTDPSDRLSVPRDDEQNICQKPRRPFTYHRKRSLLLNAVELGNAMFLDYILDTRRDLVDLADSRGRTPLWYAAEYGHGAIVKLLLATGDVRVDGDGDFAPLLAALKYADARTVGMLLITETDINTKCGILGDSTQLVPEDNMAEVVKLLLNAGAKVNFAPKIYDAALYEASRNGQKELVKLFLDAGATVDFKDRSNSRTALHTASANGHKEVVELLLCVGAEVNTIDNFGSTPLQSATIQGHTEVVELLLPHRWS